MYLIHILFPHCKKYVEYIRCITYLLHFQDYSYLEYVLMHLFVMLDVQQSKPVCMFVWHMYNYTSIYIY